MSYKSFLFLSIAIFFLCNNQLKAQTNKFEIGVEASPSFTFLKGSDFVEKMYHGTLGYSGGITFQHNWGRGIALRTNIAYERKGGEGEFEFTDKYGASIGKGIVNLNFDYLTIPVLLRFTFGKRVKYFINGGSYIGYLIKQTFVFKGTNIDYESNNTASYNSLDAGISLGTGLQYPMNEKWFLSSEIRGNMGLFSTTPFGDTKVNSVNLLLGMAYRL